MKFPVSYLVICCFAVFSCKDSSVDPQVGFIQANLDGVETNYQVVPTIDYDFNYIKPGAINLRFNKDKTSAQYWSIDVVYGSAALDIDKLPLPFVISGPNPDYSGKSPEAHMSILDPDGAPYGLPIASASSFHHEFTLTITSVANDVVTGTFAGTGLGEFKNGEFSAKLKRMNW